MTDIEESEVVEAEGEDDTELTLWTWGLSGQPSSWALSTWGPLIEAIRAVNRGAGDTSAVQGILDDVFPDAGYQAANVCLAHPPTGEFELEVTGPLSVHVVAPPDDDLGLPRENMQWDWGDGSTQFDQGCPDHDYVKPGVYGVKLYVYVGGERYGSGQEITVGGTVEPPVNPGVAERPATVFESETDDWPNTSISPDAGEAQGDEPVEEDADEVFDPGEHTVEEVLAYAADHPDEVDEIIAAEEAGKNRVTLLDKL